MLRRQVEALAGFGMPEIDIARVVGIDPKTLRKHYRDELDTGQIKANAKVAESLYRKATGEGREAVVAAIFWLKTRAGWKEIHDVAITATVSAELPTMSLDEWERRCTIEGSSSERESDPGADLTRAAVRTRLLHLSDEK